MHNDEVLQEELARAVNRAKQCACSRGGHALPQYVSAARLRMSLSQMPSAPLHPRPAGWGFSRVVMLIFELRLNMAPGWLGCRCARRQDVRLRHVRCSRQEAPFHRCPFRRQMPPPYDTQRQTRSRGAQLLRTRGKAPCTGGSMASLAGEEASAAASSPDAVLWIRARSKSLSAASSSP